jgi:hypothetical protein
MACLGVLLGAKVSSGLLVGGKRVEDGSKVRYLLSVSLYKKNITQEECGIESDPQSQSEEMGLRLEPP